MEANNSLKLAKKSGELEMLTDCMKRNLFSEVKVCLNTKEFHHLLERLRLIVMFTRGLFWTYDKYLIGCFYQIGNAVGGRSQGLRDLGRGPAASRFL